MAKMINIEGQKFGRLIPIYPNGKTRSGGYLWLCKCDCGNSATVSSANLRKGNTQSCGCLHNEGAGKAARAKSTTHGLSKHPFYDSYRRMLQRCNNSNTTGYKNYGGRGIKVCGRWLEVGNFIEDMFPSWKLGLSIDRIDNDGNYEPGNCRWATREVQSQNNRNAKLSEKDVVEIRSLRKEKPEISHAQLGELYGVSRQTIGAVLAHRTWKNVK